MGVLYVIATPIGNLDDLSPRAADVLSRVSLVAAEDTRVSRKLLNHIGVRTPAVSCHEHSAPGRIERILDALAVGDVALVSDAGTAGISDPGAALVAGAAERGFQIIAVPGPSAVTAALSVSGLVADRFVFLGFLPRRRKERLALLQEETARPMPVVCFETPHRLREALEDVAAAVGERPISISRELSKLHEETFHGTARDALERFGEPRGELVMVISGNPEPAAAVADDAIVDTLHRLASSGLGGRSLVDAAAAETGARRSRVYALSLELQRQGRA